MEPFTELPLKRSAKTPVAIITASSRGIGLACARALHERGFELVMMARSAAIGKAAKKLGALAVRGDIGRAADLKRLVQRTLARHGRIDVVVNSSGHPQGGPLLSIPDSRWQEVFQTHVLSIVRMSRLVTPTMRGQGGGVLINITGIDTYEPDLRFPVVGTLRPAMAAFTKLFAREHAKWNVRMNCVAPGVVSDHKPRRVRADLRREIPLRRPAQYREVAEAVAFLASPEARYITGETLRVDGGLSAAI